MKTSLQELIDTCVRYGRCHNLKFNTTKTEYLIIGTRVLADKSITLNVKQIEPQDQLKHLGFLWIMSVNILQLHSHLLGLSYIRNVLCHFLAYL